MRETHTLVRYTTATHLFKITETESPLTMTSLPTPAFDITRGGKGAPLAANKDSMKQNMLNCDVTYSGWVVTGCLKDEVENIMKYKDK